MNHVSNRMCRETLVVSCVTTFVLVLLMAISGCSGKGIHTKSQDAVYLDSTCIVNMEDRSMGEVNDDFIWCHGIWNHGIGKIERGLVGRAHYVYKDQACIISFGDNDTEEDAFGLWIECVFNHLEHQAS